MNTPVLQSSSVLKLNSCWQGLNYMTPHDAFVRMFNTRQDGLLLALDIVLNDDGSISNASRTYTGADWMNLPVRPIDISIGLAHNRRVRVPLAVIVPTYNILPKTMLKFSKRGLYIRDRGRCSYCDRLLSYDEATKDHVLPFSREGATTWLNCVLSCQPCNSKKANKTPEEAGMILLRKPRKPGRVPVVVELHDHAPREHLALLKVA